MVQQSKVLITRPLAAPILDYARRHFDIDVKTDNRIMTREALLERAQGKDGLLITLSEHMTASLINALPASVRVIATYSVGYEHIDLDAARARGIRITNTPDAVTVATAEIAMLLILGAARRASEGERMVRDRLWIGWSPDQLIGRRLDGKRLGIFGMGKIGQEVAKRARAFDMEIHYHNRRRLTLAEEQGAIFHNSLASLVSVSDVLSIHAPSTAATRGIINKALLDQLPRGAIVVNTARGDLVNDHDLVEALQSGQVGYAGLDVFQNEPDIHESYYDLENTFLLPHMGTSAIEARLEMGYAAVDNIVAVLAGREPPSPVV